MISVFIEHQSEVFFASVVAGFVLGFIIEIIIELKNVIIKKNGAANTIDIIFGLALCVSIIGVTHYYNYGEIRFYIFLGFFSGIGVYFTTINWAVSRILNYILCCIKKGLKKVIFTAKKLVDIICSKR